METKRCSNGDKCCHTDGPLLPATLEYFQSDASKKSGLTTRCRECKRAYDRARLRTPEYKEYKRKYHQKYYQEKLANNPDHIAYMQEYAYARLHGLKPPKYVNLGLDPNYEPQFNPLRKRRKYAKT